MLEEEKDNEEKDNFCMILVCCIVEGQIILNVDTCSHSSGKDMKLWTTQDNHNYTPKSCNDTQGQTRTHRTNKDIETEATNRN